jgi:hydroxyethylthiazole kinase
MSSAEQEIEELLGISKSVVINLSKINDEFITLCNRICHIANAKNIPIVLDPVGAGASRYRTDSAINMLNQHKISIIRGYPNEISSLLTGQLVIANHNLMDHGITIEHATLLSEKYNFAVVASGKRHIVIDSDKISQFNFDSLLLQKVAGIGSLLSSILGVFNAIEEDRYIAAKTAVTFYANCVGSVSSKASGPASLMARLIDELYISSTKAVLW